MCCPVIGPLVAGGSNRDGNTCIGHRQFAVSSGYSVIIRIAGRELVAFHHIGYRTFARERDASGHNNSNSIVSNQTDYIIFIPTLRSAIINKGFILCCYRYSLRIDGKGSEIYCYISVAIGIFKFVSEIVFDAFRGILDNTTGCRSNRDFITGR